MQMCVIRLAAKLFLPLVLSVFSAHCLSQEQKAPSRSDKQQLEEPYSRYVMGSHPKSVYWGDTHLHSSYSTDSGMIGNRLTPADAYRFARGDEVTSTSGQRVRLIHPLDFLVISDHAENLGLAPMIRESNPELLTTQYGRKWHDMFHKGQGYEAFLEWVRSMVESQDWIDNDNLKQSVWKRITDTAETYYVPGSFTTFLGFEWTSTAGGNNLHRVVVFRDGPDKAQQVVPFSQFDSINPEDLWRYLNDYENVTGGKALAIPHNGNLSNGQMFAVETFNGKPLDADYAKQRMRWEPLVEVTQIKGDSEAHPLLSPDDEFADYGTWDKANVTGDTPKEQWMLRHEYARSALKLGLAQKQKLGMNPFKFGMIGSSDSHTSLATTREENYMGKFSAHEPKSDRYKKYVLKSPLDEKYSTFGWEELSSGLAAVWAEENTREAIFDAMQRKETYTTTGTRITVRFFGGWDFEDEDAISSDMVSIGYDKGVPMGGDLPSFGKEKSPSFIVAALKDSDGANLDRVQIVKGWVTADGAAKEKVFDVVWSDSERRKINKNGKLTPLKGTVDIATASYSNSVGSPELRTVWRDPDFDPNVPAFYYARVLEIPTPTWVAYDQKYFGIDIPDKATKISQERAYTSPIWYAP